MNRSLLLCCEIILIAVGVHQQIDNAVADEQSPITFTNVSISDNKWFDDWNDGMKRAKDEKKPIFVNFYSEHCGACKAMEVNTFSAIDVKQRLDDDWISIRINTHNHEKSGDYDGKSMKYTELSKYFRVTAVPSFIFFDKNGTPVRSVVGYKKSSEFALILDYMKDEVYKKGITFSEFKNMKLSPKKH